MARSKSKSLATDVVITLRDTARSIYTHAGAFLMREVCDALADLLESAAKHIRELESRLATAESEALYATDEIVQLTSEIDRLERALSEHSESRPLPFEGDQS